MQYVKIVLSTMITVFAFMFDRVYDVRKPLLAQLAIREDFVDITWCVLALFIFVFYWKSWNQHKEFQKIEAVFSILFSIIMLLGRTFSVCDSLKMLETQKIMAILAGIGWFIFFYMLLRWVSYFVEKQSLVAEKPDDYRHIQLIAFAIILVCWLPYVLLNFPGNVAHDGMYQLCRWFEYDPPNDHHPWFMTMVLGVLMSIGRNISDNAGIFTIVLFQVIFCAWAYSRACLIVYKYAGRRAAYLTILFFAIVPMWGVYATTVIKDTLFFALFVLYFSSFIDIFESKKLNAKKWLVFGLFSLLVCLGRHEGIYIVLFSGAALFLGLRSGRQQLLAVLAGICICMIGYNTYIFNVLGIAKGPIREMLSIPFQQTARYSREHGRDISKTEKSIINKVLPYDMLSAAYNPELSDPVRGKMEKCEKKDLKKYLGVWAKMGLRHPGTYLQATINNSYNYYYPFRKCKVKPAYLMYIMGKPVNKGFNIYYMFGNSKKRADLRNYANLWCTMPGISLLSSPGAYTWIILVSIMLLLKKKKYRQLVVFSVLLMQIAICCASPVNGYLRYAMPSMACVPVLLAWVWHTLKVKDIA